MQVAEQRRRDLEQAATHDALTGLLNRAAAFEMLDHALPRMESSGGTVMALFVAIDSLKPTTDAPCTAARPTALRLTAEGRRDDTRSDNIVTLILAARPDQRRGGREGII